MVGAFVVVFSYAICQSGGNDVHWAEASVPFEKNSTGSSDVSALSAVNSAFQSWNDASGVNYRASGRTARGSNCVYDPDPVTDEHNIVAWMESGWREGPSTIGITYFWSLPGDGSLVESDMLLNGDDFQWSTSGSASRMDVESIVAHEAGHFLGMCHTSVAGATMFPTIELGSTQERSLHADDIAGAQFLYGGPSGSIGSDPGAELANCSNSGSGTEEPRSCGCSLEAQPAGLAGGLSLLGLALAAIVSFRRRAKPIVLSICVVAFVGFASSANATVMLDLTISDIYTESDSVVLGTVESVETWTDGRTIQTTTKLVVHELIAGQDRGSVIEVQTHGGELPPGVRGPRGAGALHVAGTPQFAAGDEVVVFVKERQGVLRVAALSQGKFLVSRDAKTGEVRLYRDTSDITRLSLGVHGYEPVAEDTLDGITFDAFRAALRK